RFICEHCKNTVLNATRPFGFLSGRSEAGHTAAAVQGPTEIELRSRKYQVISGGAWRLRVKLSPAQFVIIRRSLNATWYEIDLTKSGRHVGDMPLGFGYLIA